MRKNSILGFITFFMLTMFTAILSTMGEPFHLNQQEGEARFAGQNGLRRVGETIHAVYLEEEDDVYPK